MGGKTSFSVELRAMGCIAAACLLLASCRSNEDAKKNTGKAKTTDTAFAACNRVISLTPSVTEIIFALGAGDKLVGLTRFCDYPPEAKKKPAVGDLYSLNREKILLLQPELVVAAGSISSENLKNKLEGIKTRVEVFNQNSTAGIENSILRLGELLGKRARAEEIVTDISRRKADVVEAVKDAPRPRVLLVYGMPGGIDPLKGVYAASPDGLYGELVRLAGGRNATEKGTRGAALLSPDRLLVMAPDVVIILSTDGKNDAETGTGKSTEPHPGWKELNSIPAVRDGKVFRLRGGWLQRPSHRYIITLEALAKCIHPKLFSANNSRNGKER